MNNADTPAMPCDDLILRDDKGNLYGSPISSAGLTKREHFAAMAMQGLLSNGTRALVASESVAIADALLKELSK